MNREDCKFCHQKPVFYDDYFDKYESGIELASGGWTSLYIGVNEAGETVIRACGDGFTEDYFPKYCPECGRKIWENKNDE